MTEQSGQFEESMQLAHIESANCQESRSTGSVITRETNRSCAGSVGEKQLLEWNVSMKKKERSGEWRTCGTGYFVSFFSFFLRTEKFNGKNLALKNNEKVKNNK